jgi:hypothetical protein
VPLVMDIIDKDPDLIIKFGIAGGGLFSLWKVSLYAYDKYLNYIDSQAQLAKQEAAIQEEMTSISSSSDETIRKDLVDTLKSRINAIVNLSQEGQVFPTPEAKKDVLKNIQDFFIFPSNSELNPLVYEVIVTSINEQEKAMHEVANAPDKIKYYEYEIIDAYRNYFKDNCLKKSFEKADRNELEGALSCLDDLVHDRQHNMTTHEPVGDRYLNAKQKLTEIAKDSSDALMFALKRTALLSLVAHIKFVLNLSRTKEKLFKNTKEAQARVLGQKKGGQKERLDTEEQMMAASMAVMTARMAALKAQGVELKTIKQPTEASEKVFLAGQEEKPQKWQQRSWLSRLSGWFNNWWYGTK